MSGVFLKNICTYLVLLVAVLEFLAEDGERRDYRQDHDSADYRREHPLIDYLISQAQGGGDDADGKPYRHGPAV